MFVAAEDEIEIGTGREFLVLSHKQMGDADDRIDLFSHTHFAYEFFGRRTIVGDGQTVFHR